ncbi:hypothetical protein Gotri_004738, partial [Gossypium trilobum]|nr:hypothetical protein [Gossypium trilobum]
MQYQMVRVCYPALNLMFYLVVSNGTNVTVLGIVYMFIEHSSLQSAKRNCKEEYVEVEMSNVKCAKDLQAISKVIKQM